MDKEAAMTTPEKVAYLKGLCDGLGVDKESKDGKILNVVLEILQDLAADVEDLQASASAADEAIGDITDDLGYLEDMLDGVNDDGDDDDGFDDSEECDYNCEECGICDEDPDGEDEESGDADDDEDEDGEELIDEEGPMYEVTCPNCGDVVTVDESILSLGSIECPGCGKILEFDLGARDE
jgi:ribosomal protein S27E